MHLKLRHVIWGISNGLYTSLKWFSYVFRLYLIHIAREVVSCYKTSSRFVEILFKATCSFQIENIKIALKLVLFILGTAITYLSFKHGLFIINCFQLQTSHLVGKCLFTNEDFSCVGNYSSGLFWDVINNPRPNFNHRWNYGVFG